MKCKKCGRDESVTCLRTFLKDDKDRVEMIWQEIEKAGFSLAPDTTLGRIKLSF